MLSLAINGVLLVALLVCAGYMFVVSRRLQALRSGQDGIAPTIARFADLTVEMSGTLQMLKEDAGQAAHALENAISRASAKQKDIERALLDLKFEQKVTERAQAAKPVSLQQAVIEKPVAPVRDILSLNTPTDEPAEPIRAPVWAKAMTRAAVHHRARDVDAGHGHGHGAVLSEALATFYGQQAASPEAGG